MIQICSYEVLPYNNFSPMKILVLSIVGFQVAINNGNKVCTLKRIDLLVLQVSHMVLARGQQGSKLFDNLLAFHPYFFMNTLPILMETSAFSIKVAPIILFLISAPHFSSFEVLGALKGANTVSLLLSIHVQRVTPLKSDSYFLLIFCLTSTLNNLLCQDGQLSLPH